MQILTHAQNGNAARHESNVRNELDGEGGRASKGRESRNIIENRKTTLKLKTKNLSALRPGTAHRSGHY